MNNFSQAQSLSSPLPASSNAPASTTIANNNYTSSPFLPVTPSVVAIVGIFIIAAVATFFFAKWANNFTRRPRPPEAYSEFD